MSTEAANSYLRLHTFMSAAFPIGAYTYSHGMETAIQDKRIIDYCSCLEWISNVMRFGSGWNDALLLCQAYSLCQADRHIDTNALRKLNELALALCAGAERLREAQHMGSAFVRAASIWPDTQHDAIAEIEDLIALPVAVGAIGALNQIPLPLLLPASLQANSSNLVWIATRLLPLGQSDSLRIIGTLESVQTAIADKAMIATLDDLGSCTVSSDLASIAHESLESRICLT